ncbi:hypothetical protein NYG90_10070 [Helicobacter sp. XJK30-2]|uniref:Uncharacterized protein n=1 Tax=Helicobacter zhangjianzhongii TaxID=2974574 RepID=A0ACC6FUN5_9HELI|nr:hypothetical protein [Helicobacter sp. XJK30-2]MDL0083004.1 hypothetical protein [Helicobacter sp. XJK30-2]
MDKAKADFTQDLEKRGGLSLGYKIFRAVFILLLVVSVAKNVELWLKYERLQESYIDSLARYTNWDRDYILEVMKNSLSSVKKDMRGGAGKIEIAPYKERSLNKEYENINKEIEKDIENKLDKIESLGLSSKGEE